MNETTQGGKKDLNIFVAFIINLGEGIGILAKITVMFLNHKKVDIIFPSQFIFYIFYLKIYCII